MRIVQITNSVCAAAEENQLSGLYRVVTQLSQFFVCKCSDVCFNAYLYSDHLKRAEYFSDGVLLDASDFSKFSAFLKENGIDIILINLSFYPKYIQDISKLCEIGHEHGVKVIQCFHSLPGSESVSHGSWEEVMYHLSNKRGMMNKMKKYLISALQPYSKRIVLPILKQRYLKPYLYTDKIVLFTEPYIDRYLQIIHKKDRNKFAIIPNPLPFSEFLPKNEIAKKRKEAIIVGRIREPDKRLSYALKIWKLVESNPQLNDWVLTIVGDGYDENFYHWLAKKYNLSRISFEGRRDPRPYYKRASILMSTSAHEGWPMVFMEAMPMGCCCLAFDSYDSVHDIFRDGHDGCIVPENDIQGYYERMMSLMLSEEARIQMGMNAIDSSERFSMEIIGKRWKELFEEVVKGDTKK